VQVIICANPEEVGQRAAARIAHICRAAGPEPVLGVATGSSPLATYTELARWVQAGELDLSQAHAFALDEYVGLPSGHRQSYAAVIDATVTRPLRLNPANVHVPPGQAEDIDAACADYERNIEAVGGVDVQVLGVGTNGHIGFNEPTSSLGSRTRIKTLTEQTRIDNARFFDTLEEVPRYCLTQGLGTIMNARHLVLVAQGKNKAQAVTALVEGPVTALVPGSVMQLHPRATVIVDEAAASTLTLTAYYKDVFAGMPAWQRDPALAHLATHRS
jgi:glucosamine-6-phosphate deaminase